MERESLLQLQGIHATAEHELEGFEAGKAIDGSPDTYWAGSPYYVWWKLDLGQCCRVDEFVIRPVADEIIHYYIECSVDHLNWVTVAEAMDERPLSSAGKSHAIGVEARYVKLTVTYCSSGETVKIRDVQVYGQQLENVALEEQDRSAQKLFPAIACDESSGFTKTIVDDIEPGRQEEVLIGDQPGSYIVYRGIDFSQDGVNQLRGFFGFVDSDRAKRLTVEVRVDGLDGEKIGELVLFRQWKRWCNLAGDLKHEDASLLRGIHDVYLVIVSGDPPQQLMIHWLAFVTKTPLPAPTPRAERIPVAAVDEYQIYFGNLHSHTAFSDGIGVPEQAYDYARYTAGLDFLAITEHSNLYDHDLDWSRSRKWQDIQRMAEQKTEDGSFLALFGAETTWYNQFGHMNTYNLDCFINTYETEYNEIPNYYETLKKYPNSIHQWNHPWSCGNRHHDDFSPYDPELDEVMHMIELNSIEFKELGGLHYYVKALDLGWHVAPVGSQDNHNGEWGTQNTLRTGVLVEQLTRDHFYDALRHQRAYYTSALHLKVWFQVNGAVMGSRITAASTVDIAFKALYGQNTDRRIVKAEIYGEHGRVLHEVTADSNEVDYKVSLPGDQRYYFVKLYQDDGEFAVTAPVWLDL